MRKYSALIAALTLIWVAVIPHSGRAQTKDQRVAQAIADLPVAIAKAHAILNVKTPATPAYVDVPDECVGMDAAKDAARAAILKKFVADAASPERPVIEDLIRDIHALDTFKAWPSGAADHSGLALATDLVLRLNRKADDFIEANDKRNSNPKAVWLATALLELLKDVAVIAPSPAADASSNAYMLQLSGMYSRYGDALADRMRSNHDMSLIPLMNAIPRQVALLGGSTDGVAFDNEVANASRCKLQVEYLLRFQNSNGSKYSYRLVGEMPVAYHLMAGTWLDGAYTYTGGGSTSLSGDIHELDPHLPILKLAYKQGIVEGKEGTSHIKSIARVENKSEQQQTVTQVDPTFDTEFTLRVIPCDPHDSAFVFSIPELGALTEYWTSESNDGKKHDFTMKGTTARGYANLFMSEWADTKLNKFVFTSADLHNGQAILFDKTYTSSVIPASKGVGQVHITLTHIAKPITKPIKGK